MAREQTLSRQEERVLLLARQGLADKQIAQELQLSTDTVRTYWQRIRQKVGGQTRAEIVATLSDKKTAEALGIVQSEKDVLLREVLQRKAMEKKLRASELEWRHLADSMPQIVFVSRPSGAVFHLNARFTDYTGLSKEQISKNRWLTIFHPEDRKALWAGIKRSIVSRTPFDAELRIKRFDGEFRWHVCRAIPILNESGQITRWYGTATDIHESRLLRDRLQDSTTFLTQAQRIARLGSYEHDVKNNLGRWSENLFQMFGLEKIEGWFDSNDFIARIHPEDLPSIGQSLRETIDRATPFSERYRYIRPDGTVIEVHSVANAVVEKGKVVKLVGTIQDITEQSRTERRLRDSEKLLQEAEEISGIGSYSWRMTDDKSRWSQSLYRIFERDPSEGEMAAPDFYEVIHPDDREPYDLAMRTTMQTGKRLDTVYRLVFGDRVKWIHALGTAEMWEGKVTSLIGTCQDVTDRHHLMLDLEEKTKFIEQVSDMFFDIIFIFDLDEAKTIYSNREVGPSLGYPQEEIERMGNQATTNLIHPDDLARFQDHMQDMRSLKDDEIGEIIYRVRHASGKWHVVHSRKKAFMRDDYGSVKQLLGVVQDVTAR